MSFSVIHIVSNLDKVNFGIWNAAISASPILRSKYGVESRLWVCDEERKHDPLEGVSVTWIGGHGGVRALMKNWINSPTPGSSLIVSHGAWLQPTRIGFELKKLGFRWVYVPHGMLEPWSLQQGRIKKRIYYSLMESRMVSRSNAIRAVSKTELENLSHRFKQRIYLIGNGVDVLGYQPKDTRAETFLFMSRLHHKKGVVPLVRAWINVMKGSSKTLIIAGPDEGELEKIRPYLSDNIKYIGPVYGADKIELLRECHYYVLPSYSEGFPTSVVEAMSFGLIPMISTGCNFPEVFDRGLGYKIEPNIESVEGVLRTVGNCDFDHNKSLANHEFVNENLSTERIAEELYTFYSDVMANQT